MSEVQPIRDKKKIRDLDTYLIGAKGHGQRDHILWHLGIHTGLRISDIVGLTPNDVLGDRRITEQKTDKRRALYANESTKKEVQRYVDKEGIAPDGWLFPSRRSDGKNGHITALQAYRILKDAGKAVGLEHIGTHTMRKTFGYHYYKKTHDVATLMRIFNHASQKETLRYIGIETEQIEASLADFHLL